MPSWLPLRSLVAGAVLRRPEPVRAHCCIPDSGVLSRVAAIGVRCPGYPPTKRVRVSLAVGHEKAVGKSAIGPIQETVSSFHWRQTNMRRTGLTNSGGGHA